jgi:branched-chain amino acid aminotransferase
VKVWLNGQLLDEEKARVSVRDRGFLYGDGLFETLRAYDGKPFLLEAHLERLAASAKLLELPPPPLAVLTQALRDTIAANRDLARDLRVRVTLTRGPEGPGLWPAEEGAPTMLVSAEAVHLPLDLHTRGASLITSRHRVLSGGDRWKSTSFQVHALAKGEAVRAQAWEALLLNERGEVAEGATSNVFALLDGNLVTPPASAGILAGITRSVVLGMAKPSLCLDAREAALRPADLAAAREIFLTSSIAEIVPIVRLDGRAVGDGFPGPVTRAVLDAYRAEVVQRAQ